MSDYIELCWDYVDMMSDYNELCRDCAGLCRVMLSYVVLCRVMSGYVGLCWWKGEKKTLPKNVFVKDVYGFRTIEQCSSTSILLR